MGAFSALTGGVYLKPTDFYLSRTPTIIVYHHAVLWSLMGPSSDCTMLYATRISQIPTQIHTNYWSVCNSRTTISDTYFCPGTVNIHVTDAEHTEKGA